MRGTNYKLDNYKNILLRICDHIIDENFDFKFFIRNKYM
jgi:hypothetical protein